MKKKKKGISSNLTPEITMTEITVTFEETTVCMLRKLKQTNKQTNKQTFPFIYSPNPQFTFFKALTLTYMFTAESGTS